jgi:methionine-rich copper-binding protein CopC
MTIRSLARFGASVAFALSATAAFAHAQLEKAVPAVGGTVSSPSEIRLEFSERVEPRFTGVTLTSASGATQPLGKSATAPGDEKILITKIGKALAPGVYTVNWHAVSVDTHHTQGSFNFTVAP